MVNRVRYTKSPKKQFKNRSPAFHFKPARDPRLKKVFGVIGPPDKRPFIPDPYQLQAMAVAGRSDCLVTAPTGSGKTWIAQQAIDRIRSRGGKSWYASPLKALSNSKYEEFKNLYSPENVGILTGDRKENPEAPVIVGTTEILRNQLYDAMYSGMSLSADFVVLDEAHFLGDPERGVVWEEIMIYLPPRIPLLLLSATIGNAKQVAGWLSSIRSQECHLVEEKERPVPLAPLLLHPSGTLLPLLSPDEPTGGHGGKRGMDSKVRAYLSSPRPKFLASPRKLPPFGDILRVLKQYRLAPAIFFLKSRADCDNALAYCMDNRIQKPEQKEALGRRIVEMTANRPHISTHRQRWHLENLAVGSHHSGQLPSWKLVLETLMTEGLLDAVFATSTVAAGVNFPARTVVFLNSDRFNGTEFLPLNPTEFHQMTGRAGRRGMDRIGFAVAIPGKYMDLRWVARLFGSPPSAVLSQIRINFSMVLNLLLSHTPDQIQQLLEKSFATYLLLNPRGGSDGPQPRGPQPEPVDPQHLWHDFQRHLTFLKKTGFVDTDDRLTEDGRWASQLRIDHPLLIAEGLRLGIFPDKDPALLAAAMAMFVSEQEAEDRISERFSSTAVTRTFKDLKKGLLPFSKRLLDGKFDAKPLSIRPAASVYAWSMGFPWESIREISEMEDGNLVMLIFRTADCLRHVASLVDAFPTAAETAGIAAQLLMRDPVQVEYDGSFE